MLGFGLGLIEVRTKQKTLESIPHNGAVKLNYNNNHNLPWQARSITACFVWLALVPISYDTCVRGVLLVMILGFVAKNGFFPKKSCFFRII